MNQLGQRATNQYQGNSIQRLEDGPDGCCPLEGSAVIPIFHDKSTGSKANQHTSGNGSNQVAIYKLSIFTFRCRKHTRANQWMLIVRARTGIKGREHRGPDHGGE